MIPKKMVKKSTVNNGTLELFDFHFINGDNDEVKDVILTAKTQEACRAVINAAKQLPEHIHNNQDLELYIETLGRVRTDQKKLADAKARRKEPQQTINKKIEAAAWQMEIELGKIKKNLDQEILRYEEMRRQGAEKAKADLLRKATDAELEAKYSDNPAKKRHAKSKALQYKDEAKKVEPKPSGGIATHWGWRFKAVTNQTAALRAHPEFFVIDEDAINRQIKELEKDQKPISEHLFPGIDLERFSWVSYRR